MRADLENTLDRPALTDPPERRVAARTPIRRAARVVLRDGTRFDVTTFDISSSGVGVVCEQGLAKGALCAVGFDIVFADDSQHAVKAAVVVAYSVFSAERNGFKVGLQFHQPPVPLTEAIARYMGESHEVFRSA